MEIVHTHSFSKPLFIYIFSRERNGANFSGRACILGWVKHSFDLVYFCLISSPQSVATQWRCLQCKLAGNTFQALHTHPKIRRKECVNGSPRANVTLPRQNLHFSLPQIFPSHVAISSWSSSNCSRFRLRLFPRTVCPANWWENMWSSC